MNSSSSRRRSTNRESQPLQELQKPLGAERSGIARAITERVRDLILKGKLAVGTKLPPGRQLAKVWGTNQFTIRYALSPLVNEGLLESRKRGGIIVCSTKIRPLLRTVAIYSARNFQTQKELQFTDCLHSSLHRSLARDNIDSALFVDTRDEEESGRCLPSLQAAIDNREVQGVIAINTNSVVEKWLQKLKVEKASVGGSIDFNITAMMRLSLNYLAKQGCRSAGIIFPGGPGHQFTEECRKLGLKTSANWLYNDASFTNQKEFGYREYIRLSKQGRRPEGLVVYPDTTAHGVLAAVLQIGTQVPDHLQLVLHRQPEMDYFCPLPVAWVENSVSSVAEELIRTLKGGLAGEKVSAVPIPFQIVENLDTHTQTR